MSIFTEEAERRFRSPKHSLDKKIQKRIDRLERMEPAFEALREALCDILTELEIRGPGLSIRYCKEKARAAIALADRLDKKGEM